MKPLPYEIRLAAAMQSIQFAPGTVSTAHVRHDIGCPMLAGKPVCRCVPDVFIETPAGRIEVLPDGTVIQPAQLN